MPSPSKYNLGDTDQGYVEFTVLGTPLLLDPDEVLGRISDARPATLGPNDPWPGFLPCVRGLLMELLLAAGHSPDAKQPLSSVICVTFFKLLQKAAKEQLESFFLASGLPVPSDSQPTA